MYPVPDRFEGIIPEAVDCVICEQQSGPAVPVIEFDYEVARRLVGLVPDLCCGNAVIAVMENLLRKTEGFILV